MAQGKWTSKAYVAESIIVEKCTTSSTWAGSAARCLIVYTYLSFAFGSKNNNILQLGTTLNNEASVLESFLSDFWHGRSIFFRLFSKSKK
jgi:hypothetical protein